MPGLGLFRKQSDERVSRPRGGDPGPSATEELVGLLASIRALLPSKATCSVGVISALPGEGVSSVALGLATVAARNPRTKVLLCSVARESSAEGIPAPAIILETIAPRPGSTITKGSVGGAMLADVVGRSAPSGDTLMRSIATDFDLVIVELPPTTVSRLGPSLARGLDGILLVVEAERTRVKTLRSARKAIELLGGNIIGVVLNKQREYVGSGSHAF